jgi:hypothetical protein
MEEAPLAPLLELPPAESRNYLIALAQQEGAAALETLRLALEMPALAQAAVDALAEVPDQEAWDLLEGVVRSGTPPALRKGARRAQHCLRSRGFNPSPAVREVAPPAVKQARASTFDYLGNQFLQLVCPAALGMVRYADFIVSPESLADCSYALASQSDIEAILAKEDEQFSGDLVEMGLAYVARRVRQAAARSHEQKKNLPEDYIEAAFLLEGAPEDCIPEELSAAAGQPAGLDEAADLLRHPSMAPWLFEPEEVEAYVEDWLHLLEYLPVRTEEGLPNLGAIQARGQMTARIIDDLCDEDTRRRLAGQLSEQARLLLVLGEKRLAQIAVRCSAGLERNPPPDDPFLRALVGESMHVAVRLARAEQQELAQGPWKALESEGGALWVPRPAGTDEEEGEEETGPRLWLPGQ